MHCYRCGRRVADRSPRCDNCGQKFNYGEEVPRAADPEPAVAPASPPAPVVPAPPPPSGLRDSIFELSRTSAGPAPGAPDPAGADPTVPARMALTEATEQAVVALGEGRGAAIETSAEEPAGGTALSPRPAETGSFAVGKVLSGRLEIVADLGGGPLGRVFKAVDRKKGSIVAVKAIAASRLPSEALSGRFAETIQLVKGLNHPNLVRVHGAGREGDHAFVIMQHLEGLPLRRLLEVKRENGGTFSFEEAEPIVMQICQGLQFAHASLVHGGLKPENVFVQVDSLKLIDAGFSRLFPPRDWHDLQSRATGSAPYLAPEFAAGKEIDRRADVYSVGAILYEMLTGRAPHGPDAPAVSTLNPSVPRAVDRVVQKAMAASPDARYARAADLKEAVLRVLGGDILAEDLEAPGDPGTFVDPIEIEYVEAPPVPEPDPPSDDATPVGAIELQEPLWEPDEIAGTRASDPSAGRGGTEAMPRPGLKAAIPVARAIARPTVEDATAPSAIARPVETDRLGDRGGDQPSAEQTSVSALSEGGHQSIDLGGDELGETEAGFEPTTGGVVAPPEARTGRRTGTVNGTELELSEGSPLDLELDVPGGAPASPAEARRPRPTPPPWDGGAAAGRKEVPARSPGAPRAIREDDRPTGPAGRRFTDNPAVRALSPPSPPPLELTFSAVEEGIEGAPALDREADRPTADAPAPMVKAPAGPLGAARPRSDRPTLTGGAPRPVFVARRAPSRLPAILGVLVLLAAAGAGGVWGYRNPERVASFLPGRTPAALTCPAGMIAFAAGSYMQGSLKLDPDRDVTEVVSREVSVKGFCIDRYEYPNAEGAAPRTGVSVQQAAEACGAAGKRLCTEVEWERACKGSAGTRFPYGDKFEAGICNVGTPDAPGSPKTSGAFPACGAPDGGPRDLSGNVWEITASPWPDDPDARVIKGGSAKLPSWGARCAYRDALALGKTGDDVGFRCCR